MFSATKFLVAGAIVALFGGFLLGGFMTQPPSEKPLPPIGASASATTEAVSSAPRSPSPPSMSSLDTRQVGPGIVRIVGDGTGRSLDDLQLLFIGQDGSVWLSRNNRRIFRLGVPGSSPPLAHTLNWYDLSVAENGNLRAQHRVDGLQELRDGRWEAIDPDIDEPYPVHPEAQEGTGYQASDGSWWFGLADRSVAEVLRYTPEGAWQRMPMADAEDGAWQFLETPDGTMWATAGSGGLTSALFSFDGERWQRVEVPDGEADFDAQGLRLDDDGALVVSGYIFDGSPPGNGSPPDHVDVRQTDAGWTVEPIPDLGEEFPLLFKANLELLGEDGTGWAIGEDRKYLVWLDGESAMRVEVPLPPGGITPRIDRFALAPDGSLWLTIRSDHPGGDSTIGGGLYVITPEAVVDIE